MGDDVSLPMLMFALQTPVRGSHTAMPGSGFACSQPLGGSVGNVGEIVVCRGGDSVVNAGAVVSLKEGAVPLG